MLDHAERILTQLSEAVLVTDLDGIVEWGNEAMAELIGGTLDHWRGRSFLEAIHPDSGVAVINALSGIADRPAGEQGALLRIRLVTGSGTLREVECRGAVASIAGRDLLVNVLRTVDDRFDRSVDGGNYHRLRTLVDHSPAILATLDSDLRIVSASSALSRLLGHDNLRIRGRRLTDLATAEHRSLLDRAIARMELHAHLALDLRDAWGGVRNFDAHFADLRNDPTVGTIVATLTDVSELKSAERRLRELADVDPLTGALNRRAFTESLSSALDTSDDIAVLFVDLDRFKPINDHHGHQTGDAVLATVAERLRRVVRGADLVARLGGDEFAIALLGDAVAGAESTARRARASISEPITVDGTVLRVEISVGVAIATTGSTAAELLAQADAEMYREKLATARRERSSDHADQLGRT